METNTSSEFFTESQIKVTKRQTVANLLKDLKLEDAFLAVLVDGERVDLDTEIHEGQKVIILPKIAGGI